jgi:hypothetical protein
VQAIPIANRQLAAGSFINDHYYLTYSSGGSANTGILDYDTTLDSFWTHTSTEAQLAVWEGDGQKHLYGVRAGGTPVDKLFVPGEPQDNGANFAASWSSKPYTFGSPELRKRVWKLHFDGTGEIQASLAKDFSSSSTTGRDVDFTASDELFGTGTVPFGTGTDPFGGLASVREAAILTPGVARAWSVTYGNQTAQNFQIDSFTFELADRPRKGLV